MFTEDQRSWLTDKAFHDTYLCSALASSWRHSGEEAVIWAAGFHAASLELPLGAEYDEPEPDRDNVEDTPTFWRGVIEAIAKPTIWHGAPAFNIGGSYHVRLALQTFTESRGLTLAFDPSSLRPWRVIGAPYHALVKLLYPPDATVGIWINKF